ncbi:hypothetical protein [Jannaschia aquimarina]|uniref:Uncharacterized protein n=1 Tax=Jannaschia aquimarina TaxID=935700 RepID=A0A0D1EI03_9RHOB|nr:hypothetical protein [Jannaschia aquimarina]KIT17259.1 hypothetical protein jaqu_09900 [Jannaschia aquimarina]SNT19216.1 hypothetical protein SAMN05421775_107116 [Jannaschia aquimarina]
MRAVLVALLGFTGPAWADGQVLSCSASRSCDAAGLCMDDGRDVRFDLTPLEVGGDGTGLYRIAYGPLDVEAVLDGTSTLSWSEGGTNLNTLVPTGPETMVWVARDPEEAPITARTTFLTCKRPVRWNR